MREQQSGADPLGNWDCAGSSPAPATNQKIEQWKAHLNYPAGPFEGHSIKADNEAETPIAFLWVGGGTHGKPRQEANAHLIAAAPELLAALKALLPYVSPLAYPGISGAIKNAKSAIEKAEPLT